MKFEVRFSCKEKSWNETYDGYYASCLDGYYEMIRSIKSKAAQHGGGYIDIYTDSGEWYDSITVTTKAASTL